MTVRIGGGQGFYGDGVDPVADVLDAGVDYLVCEALAELTADEDRQKRIVKETFPRVRELLRDGANVDSVAQIQYRRWSEENLDTLRA